MDIFEQLECVRNLAEAKEKYTEAERIYSNMLQPLKPIQQIQAVEAPAKEKYRGWAVFGACEVVLAIVINKILSFILSYFANGGMTYAQSLAAGYISYRNVNVFVGVGAVLALPLAWILGKAISGLLKKHDNSETARAQKANEDMEKGNQAAEEENKRIAQQNSVYEAKLKELRQMKKGLVNKLKELEIAYEPAYLSVNAVDFVTKQLRSGNARTLEEAFAQYEQL